MTETTPLYLKIGRRYVPVRACWHEDAGADSMLVGTFRLTYCYQDGSRRYEYDVTPATAPVAAAMLVARVAMEDVIRDAGRMSPSAYLPYTKRQMRLIEQFRSDMGGMYPMHWQAKSAYEISEAAMRAVMGFKP